MRPRNDVAEKRPNRIPVSGNRDILVVDKLPEDKVARWVNDDKDRILKFLQGGWEFVTDQGVVVGEKTVEASKGIGSVVHRLVGTKATNEPLYAYLMVISKDWYNEDQAAKQTEVDAREESIYEKINGARNEMYGKFETTFGD